MKECRKYPDRESVRHQEHVSDTLVPQEVDRPDQRPFSMIVPIDRIFVSAKFAMYVTLDITTAHGQHTLHDPTFVQIAETQHAQALNHRRRTARDLVVGKQRVEHLGSTDRLPGRVHPVKEFAQ
jgi:hypothetical protein